MKRDGEEEEEKGGNTIILLVWGHGAIDYRTEGNKMEGYGGGRKGRGMRVLLQLLMVMMMTTMMML